MTYNQALAEIVTWITDNNNKEITAAIMRDVLTTLLDYSAENIGDTGDLFAETNTVDAINELKSLIDGIDLTLGLTVHNGINNPNTVPPSSYAAPDIYVREDGALKEVYMFNGVSWIQIINFAFPIYEAGIFKGNAKSLDFSGGNFDLTYDAITGVMTVEVTGEGVDKLEDIGDVPAYPDDGQEWVLVELDGALTWELKGSGAGGQVDSVTGDSVDNTDPANPVVNAIPLSGTEVGSPVTGDIEFDDNYTGIINNNSIENKVSKIYFVDGNPRIELYNVFLEAYTALELDGSLNLDFQNPNSPGIIAQAYHGANYDDNTYVQKKYVDDNFLNESDVIGTPRQYTAGQGTALGTLTIASGSVTPDIAAKNAYSLDIDQNVTINAPSNDRCTSWFIRCEITGAGGWTIGLNSAYKPDGGASLTIPNTTGDKFTLYVQSFGDGTHDITIHTQQ